MKASMGETVNPLNTKQNLFLFVDQMSITYGQLNIDIISQTPNPT